MNLNPALFFSENELRELKRKRPCLLVSGGADSVFLFYLFLNLKKAKGVRFSVLHVNHGLRGEESDADAVFVKKLARQHGVYCHVYRLRIRKGGNLQERARRLRRRICLELAKEGVADCFFTAHHRDDFWETLVMRQTRGAGGLGLAGMRRDSFLSEGVPLTRPLFKISKRQITESLRSEGRGWREDSSNQSDKYFRNRVRHSGEVALTGGGEATVIKTLSLAQSLHIVNDYFAERALEENRRWSRFIPMPVWLDWPDEMRFRVFVKKMKQRGAREQVERSHFDNLRNAETTFSIGEARVFKDKSGLYFYSETELNQLRAGIRIERSGAYYFGLFGKKISIAESRDSFPLVLAPAGRFGRAPLKSSFVKIRNRNISLKDYFSENGFGKYERLFTPVLWDAEGTVKILSERF